MRPSEKVMTSEVSANKLILTYPKGSASSKFQFIASTFYDKKTLAGIKDLQGITLKASGNVDAAYTTSFGGSNGGSGGTLNSFEYWSFTWTMPKDFQGVPRLELDITVP